jgi:hypothetical protein
MAVGCAYLSDMKGTFNMDPDNYTGGSESMGVGHDSVH